MTATKTEGHRNIFVALAAAQAEMGTVAKGATNPAFKSRYADLADVVSVAAPALTKHGIAFTHYTAREDGVQMMVTALIHGESETRVECAIPLIVAKNDMQGFKSATTYAKRIGLESVTGLAPEDDDGNAAAKAAPKAHEIIEDAPITADEFIAIRDLIEQSGANEERLCAAYRVGRIEDLRHKQVPLVIEALRKKLATIQRAPAVEEEPVDA